MKQPHLDAPQAVLTRENQTYAIIQHLSALAAFILPSLGNVIGALVAWLIFRDRDKTLDEQGKEVLNFQISVTIYLWAAGVIAGIFSLVTLGLGVLVALPVMGVVWLLSLVPTFIGVAEANKGNLYRYPYTIRFLQ